MPDAIPTDVSTSDEPLVATLDQSTDLNATDEQSTEEASNEEAVAPRSARDEMIESINAKHLAKMEEEIAESQGIVAEVDAGPDPDPDGSEDPDTTPDTDAAADEHDTPDTPPSAPQLVYQNEAGEQVMLLKVDGQETEVPLAKVQATMQKHQAADQRLYHANQQMRQLEEREQAIAANEQRLRDTSNMPPSSEGATPGEQEIQQARAIIDKLYDGDEGAAAEALAAVLSGRNATPDIGSLTDQITQNVLTEADRRTYQRDVADANTEFAAEFPNIMADDALFNMANAKTAELRRDNPDWTPKQIMAEAGAKTMEWLGKYSDGGKPKGKRPSSRQDNKANLQRLPQGRNSRSPGETAAPAPTPGEIIAAMRAARGQS